MLLADKTVNLHTNGIQNSNEFTIQQSAKMFNILSNSLYKDKIMAVIRELSTNAWDAHVSAGTSRPFDVHLPTRTNPVFSVRDYGTGLSQEDMEHLYTTYGASNKNDSNDFVGCLGLGSKSPFAYTKSFTTASYFNGSKYTYVAAMDETGVPTLNHISTTDTDEPNGMEISFATHQYDSGEFADKAKRVFYFFKNKPVLSGYLSDHDYVHHNVVISGENWKVGRFSTAYNDFPSQHSNAGNVVAVMGSVAYPIDVDKIIGKEEKEQTDAAIAAWNRTFKKVDMKNWVNFLTNIVQAGLYIEMRFDIGELEMDPSREGLQYTREVVATIRRKTQEVYLKLQEDLSEKIKSAPTKVEAMKSYNTLSAVNSGWSAGAEWVDPDGKVHPIGAGDDLEYKLSKGAKLYAVNWKRASYRSRKLFYMTDKIHYQTLGGYHEYRSYDVNSDASETVFFQCDTKSVESAYRIAIRYCNRNSAYAYLLVNENDHQTIHKDFKQLVKDVGEENILKISEYRHLVQSKRKSRGGTGQTISDDAIFFVRGEFDGAKENLTANLNSANLLKMVDVDQLPDTIVYVPITRYESNDGYGKIANIATLDERGEKIFGDTPIFAIKTSSVVDFEKNGYTLVDYNTFAKKRFKKHMKDFVPKYAHVKNLLKWARDEYVDKGSNPNHSWRNRDNRRQVFLKKFLHLFGFTYSRYLKNKELVSALDVSMLIERLNTCGNSRFDDAANKVLKSAGVRFTIQEINELVQEYRYLSDTYHTQTAEEMSETIEASKTYEFLPSTPTLIGTFKKVLDNNPLLKYNVCVGGQEVSDLEHHEEEQPLKPNWVGSGDSWFDTLNAAECDSLRKSLGNTL